MDHNQAVRKLAEAHRLVDSALADLADEELPVGHAAYAALLVDRIGQDLSRAQLHSADALRRTGAHKLDEPSFQSIADAGLDPDDDQLRATVGHTTLGRTAYRNSADLLHHWLNVPLPAARGRLAAVDCLIAGVADSGQRIEPLHPLLAAEFRDEHVDPRLVAAASQRILGVHKDLGTGEAGELARAELQAAAVLLIREQPASAGKHLAAMVRELKSGKRPLGALLAQIGFVKVGVRSDGLVEYRLLVLPSQAAQIDARIQAADNPKTQAGNRDELHRLAREAAAQEAGAQQATGQEWDDHQAMPDWARGDDPGGDPPGADPPGADPPGEGIPEGLLPFDQMRPELRRLIHFMQLLSSDGLSTQAKPPDAAILIDYDQMLATGQKFALTPAGLPVSAGEARAALCNAGIFPVVLGGQGRILDLGRTQRLFSKAQIAALRAARRGCGFPGCSMPGQRCEADHLDPWERGGRTDIDNSDLLCPVHHPGRHCGLFKVVKIPGSRPLYLLPPSVDPQQRLQVNTFFLTPDEARVALDWAREATARWKAGTLQATVAAP